MSENSSVLICCLSIAPSPKTYQLSTVELVCSLDELEGMRQKMNSDFFITRDLNFAETKRETVSAKTRYEEQMLEKVLE